MTVTRDLAVLYSDHYDPSQSPSARLLGPSEVRARLPAAVAAADSVPPRRRPGPCDSVAGRGRLPGRHGHSGSEPDPERHPGQRSESATVDRASVATVTVTDGEGPALGNCRAARLTELGLRCRGPRRRWRRASRHWAGGLSPSHRAPATGTVTVAVTSRCRGPCRPSHRDPAGDQHGHGRRRCRGPAAAIMSVDSVAASAVPFGPERPY